MESTGYCDTITHLIKEELYFYKGSRLVPLHVVVVVFFFFFFIREVVYQNNTKMPHIFLFFPTKAGVLTNKLKDLKNSLRHFINIH